MKKKNTIGLFVGRFQPFHEGHQRCIEEILKRQSSCVVCVRVTELNEENPFSVDQRIDMIKRVFPTERVKVMAFPNIDTIYIGRDVGYSLIKLEPVIEKISATDIRKKLLANNKKL